LSNETAAEIPDSLIEQIMDPVAKQRMLNAREAARDRRNRPQPPPGVQINVGGQQSSGQTALPPPPPPPEDEGYGWILDLAKQGYQWFKEMRAEKIAAATPKTPTLQEIVGQRAIERFIDSLSTAQGKATGTRLGKYEPQEPQIMDGLLTKQDLLDVLAKPKEEQPRRTSDEHVPV
jgi:hypothetical protein